jgi:uncharacterized protein (DUF2384 family)
MLAQMWRASGLLGLDKASAWQTVHRVGMDSIPKLRRAALDHLATCLAAASTTDIAEAVEHPQQTTRRALEDLAAHRAVIRIPGSPGKADRWEMATQMREWLETPTPGLSEMVPPSLTVPVLSDISVPSRSTLPVSSGNTDSMSPPRSSNRLINPNTVFDDKTGKVGRDEPR